MIAATAGPSAMHRAALVLHGLTDADRAWVLQALPVAQQERLRPLLHELAELGIARDAALLGPLVQSRAPAPADPGVELLEQLAEDDLAGLALLLAVEPPRVAAVLLAARPWRWRQRLLDRLPPAVAVAIDSAAPPHGESLQTAVVAHVARTLRAQPRPTPRLQVWWSRLAARLPLALPGGGR